MTLVNATTLIDNERTIVTGYRFAPGAETGFHRHAMDYVVVPMSTGKLKAIDADGNETFAELTTGVPYARPEGVEHNIINANDFEFVFVEIEFK